MLDKNRDYYLGLSYPIRLYERSEGDAGYWFAEIPDLPGCVADGAAPGEAVCAVQEAKAEWIDDHIVEGYEVPEPSVPHSYSGRLLVRIPKALHGKLAEEAHAEGVSINQTVVCKLAGKIGESVGREESRTVVAGVSNAHDDLVEKMTAYIDERVSVAQAELIENIVGKVVAYIDDRASASQDELIEKVVTCVNNHNASLTPLGVANIANMIHVTPFDDVDLCRIRNMRAAGVAYGFLSRVIQNNWQNRLDNIGQSNPYTIPVQMAGVADGLMLHVPQNNGWTWLPNHARPIQPRDVVGLEMDGEYREV